MIIAATAVEHDCELVTLDQRSFPHIPGVRLTALP
jgi:predicted nucleic acid-binding protein